ncbi:MAG: hypothetical protein C0617_00005 [Desulfuromonas sp.]|uniref:hypothetical protein n=1 Tax=Desulfuromonas sp. TaxID=892 RepID=UPI000CADCB7B|nr:hypothetical protein [Desulfuromonas sp.]PLX86751.1 MAG: hypothetical protein C0617_00005 [Desulfuromonas sp.]
MKKTFLPILLFCCLSLPLFARAMPCHCFYVRDFDPGQPAAADPYFLATTQNSFFSVVFGIEKKKVIFAKQKPRVTAEGLWILYWLAQRSGKDPAQWKATRKAAGSWPDALSGAGVSENLLPPRVMSLLKKGAGDNALASFVVDDLLAGRTGTSPKELQGLRAEGAGDAETILACLLARKTGRQPGELFRSVKNGSSTWGTLILKAEMDGGNMVEEVKSLLGPD